MQNAKKIDFQDQRYPHLKNVKEDRISTLRKVQALESEHYSNYSLLKRFLQELRSDNDNSLWMYNREVI